MADDRLGYVSALRAAVEPRRSAPATLFEGRTTSWGEMLDRAARIAGGIQELGAGPGDRVAVLSANSDDYLALYLAIPWAGAVLAPLNWRWSQAENAFAMDDCTPRLLFATPDLIAANAAMLADRAENTTVISLGATMDGGNTIDDLLLHAPIEDAGRCGDDLLAIFYTGGTTGRPKGVMLSHAGFTANCQAMRDLGLFPDGCRALIVAPLFHLAAVAALTMATLAGGTAVIARAFDPAATLDLIAEAAVTDAVLVPTMIQMLLEVPGFDVAKLASIKTILYGASPMPIATLERIMAAAPDIDFLQAYGMTEVSCTATILGPDFHKGAHRDAGRHRAAGRAIPLAEVIVAGEDGSPLPPGEVGEILVRGPGVMLGYWNQPELTAETLRGGWMHTGDGGRMDDLGLVYIVDRLKDMIVSGGENVYSAEVEGAVSLHPAVAQCAVIGVPDPRWGERVHAVIVPRADGKASAEDIIAHCRTLIAGYKCPRSVEFRTAPLPLSAAGKILKQDLRAAHWQGHDRNVA
jgi:long-chain acyl-CoA synthetase